MATNINSFFNIAQQKQFSRDFFLRVKEIQIPGLSLNGENELVYARTAKLPGRNIENKTVSYSGQVFNIAGRAVYPGSEDYSIEFYHDQNLDLRTKFEVASRKTFDNQTTINQGQQFNACMPGTDSYIILDVLRVPCGMGQDNILTTRTRSIKLIGVGIRNIGEVEYAIADGTGEVKTLTCSFSYHWYDDFSFDPAT